MIQKKKFRDRKGFYCFNFGVVFIVIREFRLYSFNFWNYAEVFFWTNIKYHFRHSSNEDMFSIIKRKKYIL